MESEAYEITTHDVVGNKVTTRLIQPLPLAQPQRFTKLELPELPEIRQQIDELTQNITTAIADFDAIRLDEYYAPLKAAEQRVAELRVQLAEAESELAEHRRQGSPRDGLFAFVNDCESHVASIARGLLDRFCQDSSLSTFKVPFDRLSPTTQKDLSLVYRIRLERFREQFYVRFRRATDASAEFIKARARELVRDLQTITKENFDE